MQLDSFNGKKDVLPVLHEYLKKMMSKPYSDDIEQRELQVESVTLKDRAISGIIRHGRWGTGGPIKDRKSRKLNYERTVDDVDQHPYYFLIAVPKGINEGIVLIERISNIGIRTMLTRSVKTQFDLEYGDLKLHVEPAVPGKLIEQFIQRGAKVVALHYRKKKAARLESIYATPEVAYESAYSEYTIRATRGHDIPVIGFVSNFIRKGTDLNKLLELSEIQSNRVSVDIEVAGRTRRIELGETAKMRAYYDITDEIALGLDGFPTFASIDTVARSILADNLKRMGVSK